MNHTYKNSRKMRLFLYLKTCFELSIQTLLILYLSELWVTF